MDFTVVVQDFLLEALHKADIFNYERLGQALTWTTTNMESVFRAAVEAGQPCFELGGMFFIATAVT